MKHIFGATRIRGIRGLFFLLILALLTYSLVFFQKVGEIPFTFGSVPEVREIYWLERSASSASVYASHSLACKLCGKHIELMQGVNVLNVSNCGLFVELVCNSLKIHYARSGLAGVSPSEGAQQLNITPLVFEGGVLRLKVVSTQEKGVFARVSFLVDGRKYASPIYDLTRQFVFEERIVLQPGAHIVEARIGDVNGTGETLWSAWIEYVRNWPVLSALVTLLALALMLFVQHASISQFFLAAFVGLSASLAAHFHLASFGSWWVVPIVLSTLLLYSVFSVLRRGKGGYLCSVFHQTLFHQTFKSLKREAYTLIPLFVVALLFTLVGFLTAPGEIWRSFYDRHVDETLRHGGTNYFDDASYLGRNFTYPPAWFDFASSVTALAGALSYEQVRLPLFGAIAFFFILAIWLMWDARRFNLLQRALATAIILGSWLADVLLAAHALHIWSYALLASSIVFLFQRSTPLSIAALTTATASHPTSLVFYPFFVYASRGFEIKEHLRHALFVALAGTALALFWLAPIFLANGLPYQIVSRQWGYLLTYGLDGLMFEWHFLLPIIAIIGALALWRRLFAPAALLLAALLFYVFISFRVNIIIAVIAAPLAALTLKEQLKRLKSKALIALICIAVIATLAMHVLVRFGTTDWCTWSATNEQCLAPMRFLKLHTPWSESLALDPRLSHVATHHGKRVLSDLYVEYADEEKFLANEAWHQRGEIDQLRTYNVSLALQTRASWPPRPRLRAPTVNEADRIYDNGYIQIYRLRQ